MSELLKKLLEHPPVITDGAWGTQLQERGLPVGACPDEWNLSHPEAVESVAKGYVEAGSQVILTNTFGANRLMLERHGLGDRVEEINRAGVEISRRAAGGRAEVFASIGPSGVLLMMGEKTPAELEAAFVEQAQALARARAEAAVIETMSDPNEAVLAIRAAKAAGLVTAACMSFDSGKNRDRTMMGTTPEQAAEALTRAGADVVGANCGQGIEGYVAIARRLKAATDRPIWIKANAGMPQIVDGKAAYVMTAEEFAEYVPQLVELGVAFIGGCCGTSPAFIAAIRRRLGR
ncbi:MAG: methionine synthase [Thermogutta sp.]|nr:methionine synthase [Thermogutta sp.]